MKWILVFWLTTNSGVSSPENGHYYNSLGECKDAGEQLKSNFVGVYNSYIVYTCGQEPVAG